MTTLFAQVPDADVLLNLAPEQLGKVLLRLVPHYVNASGLFYPSTICSPPVGEVPWYRPDKRREVALALREGWLWLQTNLFVLPIDGTSGALMLGRRAPALPTDEAFDAFTSALKFPRALVYPRIRD